MTADAHTPRFPEGVRVFARSQLDGALNLVTAARSRSHGRRIA